MFAVDLRHAVRRLISRPILAFAVIGMMALGLGLATATYGVVDALILRPVPFADADKLTGLYLAGPHGGRLVVSPAVLSAWRDAPAFAAVESAQPDTAIIERPDGSAVKASAWVTPGLFHMLGGVRPVAGRLFLPDEGGPGAQDRVLLAEGVWRSLFGSDATLIGQRIRLDGAEVQVVGILPGTFRFPAWDTAVWRPVRFDGTAASTSRMPMAYVKVAKSVPIADALPVATRAAHDADASTRELAARARPLLSGDVYDRRALPILTIAILVVLAVLSVNIAGVLLARVRARIQEFRLCVALGASRSSVLRQILIEVAALGVLGSLAGMGVAAILLTVVRSFLPRSIAESTLHPVGMDIGVAAVGLALGAVITALVSLGPVMMVIRGTGSRILDSRGAVGGPRGRVFVRGLLVCEMAMACSLLVVGALLVKSFVNLWSESRGARIEGVATVEMSLPTDAFPDRPARIAIGSQIEQSIRRVPGVAQVAWSYGLPPDGSSFSFGLWQSDAPGAKPLDLTIDRYNVDGGFFSLYGVPVVRGRTFEAADPDTAVVVSDDLARRFWPGLDPVGRTFRFDKDTFQVLGVVGDIRFPSMDPSVDRLEFYHRYKGQGRTSMVSVRFAGHPPDPDRLRQAVLSVHPSIKVHAARVLEDVYLEQLARPRAIALVASSFAAIAAVASAAGLFWVLSVTVAQRRREFGLRIALGASPQQVRQIVWRDAFVTSAAGLTLGALGAGSLAQPLRGLLYKVTFADPVVWAVVVGGIAMLAGVALRAPVREAMRANPALLLREE